MNRSIGGLKNKWCSPLFCGVFFVLLSACGDGKHNPESDVAATALAEPPLQDSLKKDAIAKAAQLMRFYFGGELQPKSYSDGPAGTLRINATDTKSGGQRTLYMLPDQRHLIDGLLYSPYMSAQQISNQHSRVAASRAAMNDTVATSREEMRKTIANAITGNQGTGAVTATTQQAIERHLAQATAAKRQHLQSVATGQNALTTAQLPSVNNVVDKESLYQQIEQAEWIAEGDSPRVLYVFFDFLCSACQEVHGYLGDYIKNGDVQVRYVPVGALGAESSARATLALVPTDNKFRLKLMQKLMRPDPLEKLIDSPPPDAAKQSAYVASLKNFKLLIDTKRVATPTFAYKTAAGAMISLISTRKELKDLIDSIVAS